MNETTVAEITKMIKLIRTSRSSVHGSQEQQWIEHQLSDDRLKEAVANLSIIALHILSALEEAELTGIELAQRLAVTRGGVTRAAKKLLEYDLVHAGKHPDDQKKIYYSLTTAGRKIAVVHDRMHEELRATVTKKLLAKYSDEDLEVVSRFLQDFYRLEKGLN